MSASFDKPHLGPPPEAGAEAPDGPETAAVEAPLAAASERRSPLGPSLRPGRRLPPPPVPRAPAPGWVELDRIVETEAFCLREVEAASALAESIVRHGQREPVDLRPFGEGYQLLSGHRRLAAARLLHRTRLLARIHEGLSDEDALLLALGDDLDRRPFTAAERARAGQRLAREGRLTPRLAALLERAEAQAPPEVLPDAEPVDVHAEEIDLEALAGRIRDQLADAANDLHALYEVWGDLDEGRREDLVECVRYLRDMYPFIAATEEEEP